MLVAVLEIIVPDFGIATELDRHWRVLALEHPSRSSRGEKFIALDVESNLQCDIGDRSTEEHTKVCLPAVGVMMKVRNPCGNPDVQRGDSTHICPSPRGSARSLIDSIAAGDNKLTKSAVHGMEVAIHAWLLAATAEGIAVGEEGVRLVQPAWLLKCVGLLHSPFVFQSSQKPVVH